MYKKYDEYIVKKYKYKKVYQLHNQKVSVQKYMKYIIEKNKF